MRTAAVLPLTFGLLLLAGCPETDPNPAMDLAGRDAAVDPVIFDLSGVDFANPPGCDCKTPELPECDNGMCIGCSSNLTCQGRFQTENKLICDARGSKACVECLSERDCRMIAKKPGMVCSAAKACVPCKTHDECESKICETQPGMGTGACVDPDMVAMATNNSTLVTALQGGKPYIRIIAAAALGPVDVKAATGVPAQCAMGMSRRNIKLYGPAIIEGKAGAALTVGGCMDLSLYQIEIKGGSPGVSCTGVNADDTVLRIRKSNIHDNPKRGLSVTKCTLNMDASQVASNTEYGLWLQETKYSLTNNLIVKNTAQALRLDGTSMGRFQLNTVANNGMAGTPGGIACGAATQIVEDSIFLGNLKVAGIQIDGCTTKNVIETPTDATQTFTDFVDFKLKSTATWCIDKIDPAKYPDVKWDYSDLPRSGMYDVGAREAK